MFYKSIEMRVEQLKRKRIQLNGTEGVHNSVRCLLCTLECIMEL